MAGRGDFGEVPTIGNPLCAMLRNGRWQAMSEPICFDRTPFAVGKFGFHSGVNLAASFADDYANDKKEPIGLIPAAEGGSMLSEWMPGELLFDHAVMQTKLAMRTSEFSGILWHQGESDSDDPEKVKRYYDRFMTIYEAFKRELGIGDIPVILGGLGDFVTGWTLGSCDYYREINAILQKIANDLPIAAFVPATGLTCRPDSIHFNSASLREFGHRYYAAYKGLA